MRVIVHHTGAIPWTTRLAFAQERLHERTNDPPHRPPPLPIDVVAVWCPLEDPHAYGDSLARMWQHGRSFINLEADVAPWPGALTQLWLCREPWCALPLIVHGAVNQRNLGCVKFSAPFIAEHRDLWASYPRNDVFDWRSLDGWLYAQLAPRVAHRHGPPALHLNPQHVREGLPALEEDVHHGTPTGLRY